MQSFVNRGETTVSFIFRGEVPNLVFEPGEVKSFEEDKYEFYTYYLPVLQVSSFIFPVPTEEENDFAPEVKVSSAVPEIVTPKSEPVAPAPAQPVVSSVDKEIAALETKSKSELQDIALRLDLATDGLKNEIKDRIVKHLKG